MENGGVGGVVKVKRGPNQFPGIGMMAKSLGVSRNHLYLVLKGVRRSVSLSERYRALKESEIKKEEGKD
jgi:hypothetical protein